jgi:hypothetical protein
MSRKPKEGGSQLPKEGRLARALPLFASGMPYAQIARMMGLSLRTVQRYAATEEVKETIEAQSEQAAQTTAQALASAREVAIGTLLEVMGDGDASPEARVKAALGLLDRTGFGPTTKHEHTGADGGAIRHSAVMTITEAKAKLAQLQVRLIEHGVAEALPAVSDTGVEAAEP